MEQETEHAFTCPYCGSEISMLIDATVNQEYVEDCEICCRPILIRYACGNGEIVEFEAMRDD